MPSIITVKFIILKGFFITRVHCLNAAAAILYASEKIMGGTLYCFGIVSYTTEMNFGCCISQRPQYTVDT